MARSLYQGIYAFSVPKYLERAITIRGGTNPYGEPLYRIRRTEGRLRLSGGEWKVWDRNLSIADRNEGKNRPLGTVCETRPIPMYPGEHGWVLERWMPPDSYGDKKIWYKPFAEGGTLKWTAKGYIPAHGDFPEHGDYEGTMYIFPEWALSESLCMTAIGRIEHTRDGLPESPEKRLQIELRAAEEEEAQKEAEYSAWARTVLDDEGSAMGAWSPGGQAEICRLAEKIGIRSHPF